MPVIHGAHRAPSGDGLGSLGPGDPSWSTRKSGTSPTNTRGQAPARGNARLRRSPEVAARNGRQAALMKPNFAARLGGLVDGVDDPHELASFFGAGQGSLALGDATEEMVELLLVRLFIDVPHRFQRGGDVEKIAVQLLVDAERVQESRSIRTEHVQVREVLL